MWMDRYLHVLEMFAKESKKARTILQRKDRQLERWINAWIDSLIV